MFDCDHYNVYTCGFWFYVDIVRKFVNIYSCCWVERFTDLFTVLIILFMIYKVCILIEDTIVSSSCKNFAIKVLLADGKKLLSVWTSEFLIEM